MFFIHIVCSNSIRKHETIWAGKINATYTVCRKFEHSSFDFAIISISAAFNYIDDILLRKI